MASKSKSEGAAVSEAPITLARLLLAVAFLIAAYLAWGALAGGSLAGCGPGSPCDKVLQSRWAYWLGLPVTIPAALVYLGFLLATFRLRHADAWQQQRAWLAVIALSVLVIAAAVWFVGLQVYSIKSFCVFCLAAHGSAVLAATILLSTVPVQAASKKTGGLGTQAVIGWRLRTRAVYFGLAGLAVLVGGQFLITKPRFQMRTIDNAEGSSGATNQVRQLLLHSGMMQIDVNDVPLIGSAQAPHVMVSLFDYTCHFCRDQHKLLIEAQKRFSNELAIVSLPMPLDADCNPYLRQTQSAHVNACEYARLGLAVWRAKPEAFPEFDSWIFAPSAPLPVDQVRQYAEQLVGKEDLEKALADPWVRDRLTTSIALFQANSREMNSTRMPQLVVGNAISVGPVERIENLYTMLREQFQLGSIP